MTSRTWFWKVAVSLLALAVAFYEFWPLSPIPLERYAPKHVIEKPKRKVRQTPAKITKEMTSVKVFRKLRQLRVNEKNKGKREKKAKEEAAKKE